MENKNAHWIKKGLIWAVIMFMLMTIIYPLLAGKPIILKSVLVAIPIWILAGIAFGFWLKYMAGKRVN